MTKIENHLLFQVSKLSNRFGKQCLGATQPYFACWGESPNPPDQHCMLATHFSNADLASLIDAQFRLWEVADTSQNHQGRRVSRRPYRDS